MKNIFLQLHGNILSIFHEPHKNYLNSSCWGYEVEKLVHVYIVIVPRKDA